MFRPLVCLPGLALVLLLQAPPTSGTFAIALTSAAGATLLALTAPQVTAIAAVAVLAKLTAAAGVLAGVAISRSGPRPMSRSWQAWPMAHGHGPRRHSHGHGKRSVEEQEEMPSLEILATLEVEDCYKRVICSASSGEVTNPRVRGVLNLFDSVPFMPLTHKAMKFVEAAQYGQGRGMAKCEHRYQCSLGMEVLQDMF
jgi:hypothetical protein